MRNPNLWPGVQQWTLATPTEADLIARRIDSARKWRRRRARLRWRAILLGRRKLRAGREPRPYRHPVPQH